MVLLFFSQPTKCYSQSSASFKLNRSSISNGGGVLNSTNYFMKETAFGGIAFGRSSSFNFMLNGSMLITTIDGAKFNNSLIPKVFMLQQNYPNPFNPSTTIKYDLPLSSEVTIKIYNARGQEIKTISQGNQQEGTYSIVWDGKNNQGQQMSSGVYYYRIITEEFTDVKKMLLVK